MPTETSFDCKVSAKEGANPFAGLLNQSTILLSYKLAIENASILELRRKVPTYLFPKVMLLVL